MLGSSFSFSDVALICMSITVVTSWNAPFWTIQYLLEMTGKTVTLGIRAHGLSLNKRQTKRREMS